MTTNRHFTPNEADALRARFALRVASHLEQGTAQMPHDITERLRFAREKAEQASRARVAFQQVAPVVLRSGAAAALMGGPSPWWLRIASLTPGLLLAAGLMVIHQLHDASQITAAAEVDAALLSDALPPAAYGDPGFAEFLRQRGE